MPTNPATIDIERRSGGSSKTSLLDLRQTNGGLDHLVGDGDDDPFRPHLEDAAEILARAAIFQEAEPSVPGRTVLAEGAPGDRLYIVISARSKSAGARATAAKAC
jgi:hypothetical protein